MRIRKLRGGEERALWEVFHGSVHALARADYAPEQLEAWAPGVYDEAGWPPRIRGLDPFVAERDGRIAGYADLQPDGYIDHFFVASHAARRGVGRALMERLLEEARARSIAELWADVSATARPFFEGFGFRVEYRRELSVRGVALHRFRMRRRTEADS